jgi:hypothetical protein
MTDKLTKEVEEFVNQEVKDLINALQSKHDFVITVLKFHLLSENLLERIILGNLTRGDRILEKGNLSFYQKIKLVDSFDIVKDAAIQSLRHLNSLRNKCSHQKGKEITFDDIEIIGRPFGKEFTQIRKDNKTNLELFIVNTFSLVYQKVISTVTSVEFDIDFQKRSNSKKSSES